MLEFLKPKFIAHSSLSQNKVPPLEVVSYDSCMFLPLNACCEHEQQNPTTPSMDGYNFDITGSVQLPHQSHLSAVHYAHPYMERVMICIKRFDESQINFEHALNADIKKAIAECNASCQSQSVEKIYASGQHLIRLDIIRNIVRKGNLAQPGADILAKLAMPHCMTEHGALKPGILYMSCIRRQFD